jgi:ankyrin repeat protein
MWVMGDRFSATGGNSSSSSSRAWRDESPEREARRSASPRARARSPRQEAETDAGDRQRGGDHKRNCDETPLAGEPELKRRRTELESTADNPESNKTSRLIALLKAGNAQAIAAALKTDASWLEQALPDPAANEQEAHAATPLAIAARHGHLELVRVLLAAKANPNWHDAENGNSVLSVAVQSGKADLVALLLDSGASIKSAGGKPLCLACASGNLQIVKLLLARGAKTNLTAVITDSAKTKTKSPLECGVGTVEIIQALLDAGTKCKRGSWHARRAIKQAIRQGHLASAKLLVQTWKAASGRKIPSSVLLTAIEADRVEMVVWLVEQGASPDALDRNWGWTCLMRAIELGRLAVVKALLQFNPQLNPAVGPGALEMAVREGRLEIVRTLLEGGEDINRRGSARATPLYLALESSQRDLAQHLLKCGARVDLANEDGDTPLHMACTRGYLDLARAIVEKGGNPGAVNSIGVTCLMLAAKLLNWELVRWLLGHGVPVNDADDSGKTALYFVCAQSWWTLTNDLKIHARDEIVAALLAAGANPSVATDEGLSPLIVLARHASPGSLEMLLSAGANVNDASKDGGRALSLAIESSDLATVQGLLKAGAECDYQVHGLSPLMQACIKGDEAIVRLLLAKYSPEKLALRAGDGKAAIHYAAEQGNAQVLPLLHRAGASLSLQTDRKKTPLMLAAIKGRLEAVRYLLEQGQDVQARDDDEWTALHYAAFDGTLELSALLIKYGASIESQSAGGRTVLHVASFNGKDALVRDLLQRGADISIRDDNQNTAFEVSDSLAVVQELWPAVSLRADGQDQLFKTLSRFLKQEEHEHDFIRPALNYMLPQLQQVNRGDRYGATLAHFAAKGKFAENIRVLQHRGVDLTLADNYGDTPLMWAARVGGALPALVQLLIYNVPRDTLNFQGSNALDIAFEANQWRNAEDLLEYGMVGGMQRESLIEQGHKMQPIEFLLRRYIQTGWSDFKPGSQLAQLLNWVESLAQEPDPIGAMRKTASVFNFELLSLMCKESAPFNDISAKLATRSFHSLSDDISQVFPPPFPLATASTFASLAQRRCLLAQLLVTEADLENADRYFHQTGISEQQQMQFMLRAEQERNEMVGIRDALREKFKQMLAGELLKQLQRHINVRGQLREEDLHQTLTEHFGLFRACADLFLSLSRAACLHLQAQPGKAATGSALDLARQRGPEYFELFMGALRDGLRQARAQDEKILCQADMSPGINQRLLEQWDDVCVALLPPEPAINLVNLATTDEPVQAARPDADSSSDEEFVADSDDDQ